MAKNGMEYMGRIGIKKKWSIGVSPDGVEAGIWGIFLPPWVVPISYHIKCRVISTLSVIPEAIQEYRISGRAGTVTQDFEFTPDPNNETLSELMNVFLPHEPGSVADGAADTQVNVGLTSREVTPFLADEFFSREVMLGLPQHAVFQADTACRYIDYFSSPGNFKKVDRGDYTEGYLIGFGATTEDFPDSSDESNALIGGAGATNPFAQLLDDINDAIEGSQSIDFQMGLDTNMLGEPGNLWHHGPGLGVHPTSGQTLVFDTTVSIRTHVYRPTGSSKLSVRAA